MRFFPLANIERKTREQRFFRRLFASETDIHDWLEKLWILSLGPGKTHEGPIFKSTTKIKKTPLRIDKQGDRLDHHHLSFRALDLGKHMNDPFLRRVIDVPLSLLLLVRKCIEMVEATCAQCCCNAMTDGRDVSPRVHFMKQLLCAWSIIAHTLQKFNAFCAFSYDELWMLQLSFSINAIFISFISEL